MYGIVTYHDGINFGAYLQAYALQQYLFSIGIDNEIINYKNIRHWFNEYKCFLYTKRLGLLVKNIIKINKFKAAQSKFKKTIFFTHPRTAKNKHYKGIIFGSDEIWNFSNPLVGRDLFYFGKGLEADKLIAYSASFGNVASDTVIDNEIRNLVSKFSYVSLRDENSLNIIRRIYFKPTLVTLDPTLLYDLAGLGKKCPFRDFILVYSIGFDLEAQQRIRAYADSKRKKLISLGWWNQFCDINQIAIDPFDFLGYFKAADEVFTNMYHGALFAIKNHKKFCLFDDPYRRNKLSILSRLQLENRVYDITKTVDAIMNKDIDYKMIDSFLAEDRAKSEQYLREALNV